MQRAEIHLRSQRTSVREHILGEEETPQYPSGSGRPAALSSGMLSGDVEKRKLSSGSSNIILRISIKCNFLSFSSKQKKTLD